MTAYEQADQERKQLWDRKELVKSQLKDIVNPEELAKQKKRYGILEAMYEEALLRMEAARPPKDKRRKAPKQRRIALYMEGVLESENACRGEAKDGAVADIFGNTVRWTDLDIDPDDEGKKARLMRCLKRGKAACSPRQQEMLDLFLQGKSIREIAEATGVDKTTVSRNLKRAKKTINEIEGAMRNEERAEARGVIDFSSREVAEDILSSLTETQAVYLYLYYGEWLSLRDIGELLDKSHVSVCNGIHRAVKRIREKYNDNEDLMLCGVEDLEPMLYEIYQQPDIEHLVPQRAKDAAKHAYVKRRFPENMKKRNLRHREIWNEPIWAQRRIRKVNDSRLLRALQDAAAQRATSVLNLLSKLITYARKKILKGVDSYYEWKKLH